MRILPQQIAELRTAQQNLKLTDPPPSELVEAPAHHGVSTKKFFAQQIEHSSKMLETYQQIDQTNSTTDSSSTIKQLQDVIARYKVSMAKAPDGPNLDIMID